MYLSGWVFILLIVVLLTLCITCTAFYRKLRTLHKIVMKLEGIDEREAMNDDSKWGDAEGMR